MLINFLITLLVLATDSLKDYHIFQGIDYIYRENYESARKEFEALTTAIQIIKELQQIYTTNTSLLYNEAELYYKKEEYQKAITTCTYSLSLSTNKRPLNPRIRASCYLMLGKCHNELKETEKARTNCKLATRELNGINKDWTKELRKESQKLLQKFKDTL